MCVIDVIYRGTLRTLAVGPIIEYNSENILVVVGVFTGKGSRLALPPPQQTVPSKIIIHNAREKKKCHAISIDIYYL